jgi:small ligand-binding sensory domain FIST
VTQTGALVAGSGLGQGEDQGGGWKEALGVALESALAPLEGRSPDALVLFVHAAFADDFGHILSAADARSHARELIGCSASGVIGGARELERVPGIAALALALPSDARVHTTFVAPDEVHTNDWASRLPVERGACTGLVLIADPFTCDVMAMLDVLQTALPKTPIIGGLASGDPRVRATHVFHGGTVHGDGAVVVALSGSVGVRPVVSQGCEPIGAVWTVTDAAGHIVRTIGNRPAYEVLVETLEALSPAERERAARNLLVGLAADEYRDEFRRGDFLIRNLMGADPRTGAVAVGGELHVGQTLQFQIRDARAADDELKHMLAAVRGDVTASAALLFACNGRGIGLFGEPDHDARTTTELLGPLPLAGFFCNGEIGPVGSKPYIHGFTASVGLIG